MFGIAKELLDCSVRTTFNHVSDEAKESFLEMLDTLSEEICKQVKLKELQQFKVLLTY